MITCILLFFPSFYPFLSLLIFDIVYRLPLSRYLCTWLRVSSSISFLTFCNLLTVMLDYFNYNRFVVIELLSLYLTEDYLTTIGYGPHCRLKVTTTVDKQRILPPLAQTAWITMSGIPSLTILSEEQKFNGDNLLQWKTNITQLLGSKGLLGYINGKIPKPSPESVPLPSSESETMQSTHVQPVSTPIYSSTPTLDEWIFRDQLARGHITLNCTDIAGLGVTTTGTAKEAWDSIQHEWGRSTDMCCSHAQEALNQTIYVEWTEIQDHIKLLRMRKAAVDNLCESHQENSRYS